MLASKESKVDTCMEKEEGGTKEAASGARA